MSVTRELISDLRELHRRSTPGVWTEGDTSHHTVAMQLRGEPYRVAEFRHADDASFCDAAHQAMPALLDAAERALLTEFDLWRAQLEHWPTSERMTTQDAIHWAWDDTRRVRSVLMAIQYPVGVFYRIPTERSIHKDGFYRGFRFSLSGPDYLSF